MFNTDRELNPPFVIVTVGIPGSGKTTVAQQLAKKYTIPRVSPDDIREELTGNAADQSVEHRVWPQVYSRTETLLQSGQSVVFDATNTSSSGRRQLVKKLRRFGAKTVVAIVFLTPLVIAQQRNTARHRAVPDPVLEKMHTALTRYPVSRDEGFDKVVKVQP